MALSPGTRIGPYEITAQIGEGGMGAVYRGSDSSLGRQVAIKVLPDAFVDDAERVVRFEREARTLAALNHPNIAAIYAVEKSERVTALIMELVGGEDLSQRIARGAIPIDEALPIARQIAGALTAAHEQGIVHRDLKPANIKVRSDGTVKVLDFGLAKAIESGNGLSPMLTQSPTMAPAMTTAGMLVGTAAYMAPEQARGRPVDKRADIWAFGCVLYEMLTATQPFRGGDLAEMLAAIVRDRPDLAAVPPQVRRLLARCFEKDPARRLRDLGDAWDLLDDGTPVAAPSESARSRWPLVLGVCVAAAMLALGAAGFALLGPSERNAAPAASRTLSPVVRFQLTLPSGLRLVPEQPPALTFDGSRLALVALDQESNRRQVYVRLLNSLSTQPLTGTLDAQYPFWSPDGRRLAFFANGSLRLLELDSGQVQDLAPAPNAAGAGLWLDDRIVFPRSTGPVVKVPLTGGIPQLAAPFDASRESNQSLVGALADGRLIVSSQAGLFVASPDGTTSQRLDSMAVMPALLARSGSNAVTADALVFIQNGRLVVQRFEASTLQVAGEPLQLGHDASGLLARTAVPFVATTDVLAFTSRLDIETRPTWVDRSGKVINRATSVTGQIRDLRLSPDGTRLAIARFAPQRPGFELLLVDLRRDTVTRTAPGWSLVIQPSWMADGSSIVAVGQRGAGARSVIRIPAVEGAAPEELLRPTAAVPSNPDVSPDGQWLAFSQTDNTGNFDLFVKPLTSDAAAEAMFSSPAYESGGRLSPDGRWLAYHSSETGPLNVFIRSFPDGRVKQQVSLSGGQKPVWRADGRELFYLSAEGDLIAASMKLAPTLEVGERHVLFRAPMDVSAGTPGSLLYDVAPDGQRFLITLPTSDVPQPITVIFNWRTLLTPPTDPPTH